MIASRPHSPTLDAVDVRKRFGRVPALEGVSLEVEPGQVHGLVGPNGSGKSTFVHLVAGLDAPDSGGIALAGHPAGSRGAAAGLGFAPDDLPLPAALTGRDVLSLHDGLRGRADAPRSGPLIEALGLADHLDRAIGDYSHGMRRKLLLVAAVMHGPSVLVLDEPYRGLDPVSVVAVSLKKRACADEGAAVLVATHDLVRAERECDVVTVLVRGRVAAQGAPRELVEEHRCDDLEGVFLSVTGASGPGDVAGLLPSRERRAVA